MDKKKEQLKKAFDSTALAGKYVMLNEEQASAFVDGLKDESVILKNCRIVTPKVSKTSIAKLYPVGRFLQPGTAGEALGSDKRGEVSIEKVDIDCKVTKAVVRVLDEELANNIEGQSFEDTLIKLVQKKLANEIEELALYARKRSTGTPTTVLEQFNGWFWSFLQSGNVVNAADSTKYTDRKVAKEKFRSAVKSLPTRFRQKAQFIIGSNALLDYQAIYETIADSSVRNELMSTIMKKRVIEAPLMGDESPVPETTVFNITSHTAGTKTFGLTDETGLVSGDIIVASYGTADAEVLTVDVVSADSITVLETPVLPHTASQKIRVVSLDGAEALLTDPLNLIFAIQTNNLSFEVERIAGIGWDFHRKYWMDTAVEEPTAGSLVHSMLTED